MSKWEDLSMKERHLMIKVGVANGLRDILSIKELYNSFAEGGLLNKPFSYSEVPVVRYEDGGQKLSQLDFNTLTNTQKSNMDYTWKYLSDLGYRPEVVASIMGNIMLESSFIPTVKLKGGDNAYGIFQMHGQRLDDYNDYINTMNLLDNLLGQLSYMNDVLREGREDYYINGYNSYKNRIKELNALKTRNAAQQKELLEKVEYFNKVYKKREDSNRLYPIRDLNNLILNNKSTINQITDSFVNTIERAGKPEYDKRRGYAHSIFKYYSK